MKRLSFMAGTAALLSGAVRAPGVAKPQTVSMKFSFDELKEMGETLRHTATARIWQPPSAFPKFAPLAFFRGHTNVEGKSAVVLWINVEHGELMTPRASHPEDEDPIVAAMLLGESDRHLEVPAWKHFYDAVAPLGVENAHAVGTLLSHMMRTLDPVVTAPHVSDEEFARNAFPFAVIRYMTPGVPGVETDNAPPGAVIPKDSPMVYAGRNDQRHPGKPVIWGDTTSSPAEFVKRPDYQEIYMRNYILAVADMQPPDSPEKAAYEAARAQDERSGAGVYTARFAFASSYLPRVRALISH